MVYVTIPLKPVAVPPVTDRRRYRLWLLAIWAVYTAAASIAIWLVVHFFPSPGTPEPFSTTVLYIIAEVLAGVMSWLLTAMHARKAAVKRWRKVAQPYYQERLAEIKGWSWEVIGAAIFDLHWRIVAIGRGPSGSSAYEFSVPVTLADPVAGIEDTVGFGDVLLAASDYMGQAKVTLGGRVTLTYMSGRDGPPPLETRLQP